MAYYLIKMQRLSSFDAAFLYLESPTSHMHVGSLALYDPTTAPDGWSFERVCEVYADRIQLVPQFRRRLVEVPLQLDHPAWVDDPDFDLGWHIRRIGVPPPGGLAELAFVVSELIATQLDRSRPLWEVWVIEGLANGQVAVLSKAHHAAIDGVAGTEIVAKMLDLSPAVAKAPPQQAEQPRQPVPGDAQMLARAAGSLALQPLRAVKAARRGMRALQSRRAIVEAAGHGSLASTLPGGAPRVSFSHSLTPERSFAFRTYPLKGLLLVKEALGTHLNDLVLAVCGGALRRYLDKRSEEVDHSLVAMVPMSIQHRDDSGNGDEANQLMNMFINLGSDVADPLTRLAFVIEQTEMAKAQLRDGDGDPVRAISDLAPATLTAHLFKYAASHRVADAMQPLFNLTMSNVRSARIPLYLAGAEMVANYPIAPIYDGNGLNITVMTYRDQMDVGIVACPQLTPDVELIAESIAEAIDEYVALTR